jgi:hypothetical protein
MATSFSNLRIASLKHRSTPYRGEWNIHASHTHDSFTALHEVMQADGLPKVVEKIHLQSLTQAQTFTSYLISHGWQRTWAL